MMKPGPDIGRHLTRAWEVYSKDFGPYVLAQLVIPLIILGLMVFTLGIGALIMGPALAIAQILMFNRALRGETVRVGTIFDVARGRYLHALVGVILLGLMAYGVLFIGLAPGGAFFGLAVAIDDRTASPILAVFAVLFMVAGLCWAYCRILRWMFCLPIMVDTGRSFGESRHMSIRWVRDHGGVLWHFLFFLVAQIIGSIGSMACYVGALFTLPIQSAMFASLYQEYLDAEAGTLPATVPVPGPAPAQAAAAPAAVRVQPVAPPPARATSPASAAAQAVPQTHAPSPSGLSPAEVLRLLEEYPRGYVWRYPEAERAARMFNTTSTFARESLSEVLVVEAGGEASSMVAVLLSAEPNRTRLNGQAIERVLVPRLPLTLSATPEEGLAAARALADALRSGTLRVSRAGRIPVQDERPAAALRGTTA
ncbi:MAG: hypothetical protein HY722_14890 [Planctomycetes bacterium]|nr:hypothetical protein [Planctomycetota bacterium]